MAKTRIVAQAGEPVDLIDVSGAEPVIAGTSIDAHRVAALCDEMQIADILRDYPSLDERQVRAARAFAERNPRAGSSYPTITAKEALRRQRVPDGDGHLPPRG